MALPRAQRVRRTGEFVTVRQQGVSWTGRLLIIAVLSLPNEPHARFGFTVTKRLGNAVVRNKIRRRLAAIIAAQSPRITKPGLIVTISRPAAAKADFDTLKLEWIKLACRAGLLPSSP